MKKMLGLLALLLAGLSPLWSQMEYIEETNIQHFVNYNDFYQPPFVTKDQYNLSEKCTTPDFVNAKVYVKEYIFNIPLRYRICDKDFEFEVDGKKYLLRPEQIDSVLFDEFVYYPAANYEKTFRKVGFLPVLYHSNEQTIYAASICSVREVDAHPMTGNSTFQFDETKKILIYNSSGKLKKSFNKRKKSFFAAFTKRESDRMKRVIKKEKLSLKEDKDLRILFHKSMRKPVKM